MSDHKEAGAHGHVVPIGVYVAVFLSLMCLTALTTGVAYIDLGAFNTVAALAIAVIKMLLVVLFFMHVKYATGLTRVVIIAGFFWLGIMITLSLSDELTRGWEINPAGWTGLIPFLHHLF
ncbi:MAG TPA: cytochrome C oxidase subunit IV family protein [Candidatus Acidoferrales bacterium]|jgi:cytochrome c oxidase subunit 4|nr:cytochrome C oxidase subunit IV family protein [Candidatus Acidoferrales bacterium]